MASLGKFLLKFGCAHTANVMVFISLIISASLYANFDANHDYSIVTYNIRNYNLATNQELLKKHLKSLNSEIIAVQEIRNTTAFKEFITKHFPKYSVKLTKCGGRGKQRLGLIYNKHKVELLNFEESFHIKEKRKCNTGVRPLAIAHLKFKNNSHSFLAYIVHLKSGNKAKNLRVRRLQYQLLNEVISKRSSYGFDKYIILGDFNTTGFIKENDDHLSFKEFQFKTNTINISSKIECSSYWSGGNNDSFYDPSHLDHILVSKSFLEIFSHQKTNVENHCKLNSCNVVKKNKLGQSFAQVSDHCPIKSILTRE